MVGIDKISLQTRDFRVKDASQTGLRLKQSDIDLNTGEDKSQDLFFDQVGGQIKGARAYANVDGLYSLNIDNRGLQVIFNPSKYHHPYNLTSDPVKLQESWQPIEQDLKDRGIISNWEHSAITRLDLARNITLKNPCISYTPVWSLLNVKRTKDPKTFPDGYGSHNGSKGVNFYNKGRELNEKGLGDNTMRGEYQYKRKRAVRTSTGIHLFKNVIEAGEGYMKSVFVKDMKNEVFRTKDDSGQIALNFNDVASMLIDLKNKSPRKAIDMMFGSYGVNTVLDMIGGIEAFKLLLKRVGYTDVTIWSNVKKATTLIDQHSRLTDKETDISTLYRELQYKFVA